MFRQVVFAAAGLAVALSASINALAPAPATAHSYKHGDISIGHIWAPPPEAGADGLAVYGPLLNNGSHAVRLVGASSPAADMVRFRMQKDGETAWREEIALEPGRPLALAPWREHVWLSGLHGPVKEGDAIDMTLDFGEAGTETVKIMVEKASGH